MTAGAVTVADAAGAAAADAWEAAGVDTAAPLSVEPACNCSTWVNMGFSPAAAARTL